VHVFKLGLADWWETPSTSTQVYRVFPLDNVTFDANGHVSFFPPCDAAELSYTWRDTSGGIHYVNGEIVYDGDPVRAKQLDLNNSIVEGSAHGLGRAYLNVQVGTGEPPLNTVYQDPYGALLSFNSDDVGRRMRVDYWLRTDADSNSPRSGLRDLIMVEDRQISSAPQRLNLVGTGIDGSRPLFDFEPSAHMLAIDLNTGDAFLGGPPPPPPPALPIQIIDYGRGEIWVDAPGAEGHTLRFYYRTTDQDTITVQKAPSLFLEETPVTPSEELYRSYTRDDDTAAPYTMLVFPISSAGQTVAVDYIWNDTSGSNDVIRTAVGEMHTINASDSTIRLNNANVQSIIAVRGMSLKVRAWWRTTSGRLTYFDVDTILGLRPIS